MRLSFGRFTFDSGTRELLDEGRRVHLSPKAFDVLQVLLERSPSVVTKTELQDRVWAGTFVGDASLSVVVAEIRQALGDKSRDAAFVRTVHRVGYAFCGAVKDLGTGQGAVGSFCGCWLAWENKAYPLVDGINIVGRDPRCTVWLDGSGVSKRHARISISGGRATIEDLESRNGTFVAGHRITAPHELSDGDIIELGAATMSFRMWSDDRPPKTERIAGPRRR
jgi:DNA-binding winged helix-turn-helix (wHTH) protein